MKYKFSYQTRVSDLWLLSMYSTYSSLAGMSNIIFTVAMFVLTITFWNQTNLLLKILLIISICLFPIFQPLGIYLRAKKQISALPGEMEIGFNDQGIQVKSAKELSQVKWKAVRGVSRKPNMIVIYSTEKHGFMLTNRVLGEEKEAFYRYVVSKINK